MHFYSLKGGGGRKKNGSPIPQILGFFSCSLCKEVEKDNGNWRGRQVKWTTEEGEDMDRNGETTDRIQTNMSKKSCPILRKEYTMKIG